MTIAIPSPLVMREYWSGGFTHFDFKHLMWCSFITEIYFSSQTTYFGSFIIHHTSFYTFAFSLSLCLFTEGNVWNFSKQKQKKRNKKNNDYQGKTYGLSLKTVKSSYVYNVI